MKKILILIILVIAFNTVVTFNCSRRTKYMVAAVDKITESVNEISKAVDEMKELIGVNYELAIKR